MNTVKEISKEDVEIINSILNPSSDLQVITMDTEGRVKDARVEKAKQGYVIRDFRGRIIRHQVSVYTGGKQTIVANAGDRFDQIPLDKRKMVDWSESDFQ